MLRRVSVIAIFLLIIGALSYISVCMAEDAAVLIKMAETLIGENNDEEALSTLDAAFEAANSAGDYEALMKIGDLYLSVDKSYGDKAMKAWTEAGKWKCR